MSQRIKAVLETGNVYSNDTLCLSPLPLNASTRLRRVRCMSTPFADAKASAVMAAIEAPSKRRNFPSSFILSSSLGRRLSLVDATIRANLGQGPPRALMLEYPLGREHVKDVTGSAMYDVFRLKEVVRE